MHRKDSSTLIIPPLLCFCLLALAAYPAAAQEEPRPKVHVLPAPPEVRPLPASGAVERQLAEGEAHVYTVKLKRGGSLRLDLTEKGVDCVLAVGPQDQPEKFRVDFGNGLGRETITFIAKDEVTYAVAVTTPVDEFTAIARIVVGAKPHAGVYSLTATINPAAGKREQQRAQAVQVLPGAYGFGSPASGGSARASIQRLEVAFKLWQELGENHWAGYTANVIGGMYFEAGQHRKAVEQLKAAVALFHKAGSKQDEALVNSNLGALNAKLERHQEALQFYAEAMKISQEIGDELHRASILNGMGVVYASRGETQKGFEFYERALQALKGVRGVLVESNVHTNMGELYAKTGEVDKALQSLTRALTLAEQMNDINVEAAVLSEIAALYSRTGKPREAMSYGLRALSLYEKSGSRRGQAGVHYYLGAIYGRLGEWQAAIDHVRKSAAIHREGGDDLGVARALAPLAELYYLVGDAGRASQSLREARALLKGKESENPQLYAALRMHEGFLLDNSGDAEAALSAYNEVIEVARAIGYRNYEAAAWMGMAELYLARGDAKNATHCFDESLAAAVFHKGPELEASALMGLMLSWGMSGNHRLAVAYGKAAVNKHHELRTRAQGLDEAIQKSYLRGNAAKAYIGLAYFLLRQGRHAEAFQVVNAFQDQQLYDSDRAAGAAPAQLALTSSEAAFLLSYRQMVGRRGTLERQAEELGRRAGEHPSSEQAQEIARLTEQWEVLKKELSAALAKADADFSKPSREDEPGSAVEDLKQMQTILRELSAATGQKSVAIYTIVGGGGVAALFVTPDSVTSTPIVGDDHFDEKVLQYYAVLQTRYLDPRPLGKELYDLIVKPLEPALRAAGAQTLLWSLGGTLRYVPMASLWDGEKYLVERYGHVVFTRADRERMTRAVSPAWIGMGFGNSRAHTVDPLGDGNRVEFHSLLGVSQELPAIFRPAGRDGVVKGEVFMDGEFTRASFLGLAKQRPVLVHVASHFSFRPGDDAQSFLLLGDGTTLTLSEMKRQGRLFEGVELLTLSACETAATRADAMGREIDGFAESAQRLGAAAVMATLWTVADNSTSRLMREFYRARQGVPLLTKAEALRRAQLALLNGAPGGASAPAARASAPTRFKVELVDALGGGARRSFSYTDRERGAEIIHIEKSKAPAFRVAPDKPFAHPYYWAPFILIGNGR